MNKISKNIDGLSALTERKQNLNTAITEQKNKIKNLSQETFSLNYLSGYALGAVFKKTSILDGFLFGFKLIKLFRRIVSVVKKK